MKTLKMRTFFILLMVLLQIGSSPRAYSDACSQLTPVPAGCDEDCDCTNTCNCTNIKYSQYANETVDSNNSQNSLTVISKELVNSMASGRGVMVQLKAYCDAWYIEKGAKEKLKVERALAAAASAVCLFVCPLSLLPGMTIPCSALVATAGGVTTDDMKWMFDRTDDINRNYSYLEKELNDLRSRASDVADDLKKSTALAVAGSLGAFVPGGPCVLGGIMADEADKKFDAFDKIKNYPGDTCKGPIRDLKKSANSFLLNANNTDTRGVGTGNGGNGGNNSGTGSETVLTASPSPTPPGNPEPLLSDGTTGKSGAAAMNRFKKFNTTKLDPEALDDALREHLHMNLEQFANKADQAKSISDLLSDTVPGLSEDIKNGLIEREKDKKKRPKNPWEEIFPGTSIMKGGPLPTKSSFGSQKNTEVRGAIKQPEMIVFPGKRKVANSTSPEKIKEETNLLEGDDIYHSTWKGLIFKIISLKIQSVKSRLNSAEWIIPFNRIAHGLPPSIIPSPSPSPQIKKTPRPSPSPHLPSAKPSPHKTIVPEFIEPGAQKTPNKQAK